MNLRTLAPLSLALLACTATTSALAQQKVDPARSEISFVSKQMGVPVEGRFRKFDAQIAFDPKKPEAGKVAFTIDLGSTTLGNPETDAELDNLVGGGVPDGQSPDEALWREGWEEAGFGLDRMRSARPSGVIELLHDLPEGLQRECLHVYDLEMQPAERPVNQDGEVAEFLCLPVQEALERAAMGEMTLDAALVTLDFGLRHGMLRTDEATDLIARVDRLKVGADSESCSKFCNA